MFGNGLDKKSINYKVKWVDDNQDYILNFRSNDIINKADNKTCFISSCLEYERFIEFMNDLDKTLFNSYLPIQLDASCNGYQHLALLTKETKLFLLFILITTITTWIETSMKECFLLKVFFLLFILFYYNISLNSFSLFIYFWYCRNII